MNPAIESLAQVLQKEQLYQTVVRLRDLSTAICDY
jgi:hypothetical protein